MTTIDTKHSIGDVVYFANTVATTEKFDCPDCLGEGKWTVTSPAGGEYTFFCPRCTANYHHNHELSLKYQTYVAAVIKLTVGSVRYDSHDGHDGRHTNSYMCVETGVGGGSIYREDQLFTTEAEAWDCANAMALVQFKESDRCQKQYHGTLALSDYQLDNAVMRFAEAINSARRVDLSLLCDELRDVRDGEFADEIDAVIEAFKFTEWQDLDHEKGGKQ